MPKSLIIKSLFKIKILSRKLFIKIAEQYLIEGRGRKYPMSENKEIKYKRRNKKRKKIEVVYQ